MAAAAGAVTSFAIPPAQAMTISTPAGLNAAIQQLDVKQDVRCICGRQAYYRPYYSYAYAYQPSYAYTYQPYYTHDPYRPYYSAVYGWPSTYAYAYQPDYSYAYVGDGRRHWIGWR